MPRTAYVSEPQVAEAAEPWIGMYDAEGRSRDKFDHAHAARVCVVTDIATPGQTATAEFLEDLNAYLSDFAAPIASKDGKATLCLHCGEVLAGSLTDSLFGRGGFEWGLAHGEGHCRCCHWPARLYHFVRDRHGEDLVTFRHVVLQYLPITPEGADARASSAKQEA